MEVPGSRFTTRVTAVALATVFGFLSTAPTLAADEAGTFSPDYSRSSPKVG